MYAAIRQARPGGLGSVDAQDVTDEPTLTLLDVMKLAAGRDGIAREYATAFELTFETSAPILARARRDGLAWDEAVVETFLTLLADWPDTHIARRAGPETSAALTHEAKSVLALRRNSHGRGSAGDRCDGPEAAQRGQHRQPGYYSRSHCRSDLCSLARRRLDWECRRGQCRDPVTFVCR